MKRFPCARLGALLLTLLLAAGAFPSGVFAAAAAAEGGISWQTDADTPLRFERGSFKDFFDSRASGDSFRYATFQTDESLEDAGAVYFDYQGDLEEELDRDRLEDTDFYYSSDRYGDFPLSGLTFVPASGAAGSAVSLTFTVCGRQERYSGLLTIAVTAGSGGASGSDSQAGTGGSSGSDSQAGTGGTSGSDSQTGTGGTSGSGSQGETAPPEGSGASQTGGGNAAGQVEETPVSYAGDIRYAAAYTDPVRMNAGDFNRFFRKRYPGGQLSTIRLQGAGSSGSLYYNYYGTSQYGSASRRQLTASNCGAQLFYFSPASEEQYSLAELTWFPASGVNTCVMLPFTAAGTDGAGAARTAEGTVLISATEHTITDVYGATPKGMAVSFPGSSIVSAVSAATGATPAGVQLLSLPDAAAGVVYYGSGTIPASISQVYTYPAGTQPIGSLRFQPNSGFTGSVEIPYVALDAAGRAIGAGSFNLGIVSSLKRFRDVTSSAWCYKYVTELADAGVLGGYSDGTFHPDAAVSYGAALKLIMLAAGYPELAPTTEGSPFSGYLTRAKADGFVTRNNVDLSASVTRLQVAQLAAGAMKLDTSRLSSVQPFTDTTSPSVQALNAAGIINGYYEDGVSTFRPDGTVTRGQVAAIVWRMRNYQG